MNYDRVTNQSIMQTSVSKIGNFNYAVPIHIVFNDVLSKQLSLMYLKIINP